MAVWRRPLASFRLFHVPFCFLESWKMKLLRMCTTVVRLHRIGLLGDGVVYQEERGSVNENMAG